MKNRQRQDAFGQLLTSHFAGEPCGEFVERDDGYLVATDNLAAYFAPYSEWPPRMQQAMQFVRGRAAEFLGSAGGQYVGVIEKEE